jgi:uncharacterized protein (TIGR03086 family)
MAQQTQQLEAVVESLGGLVAGTRPDQLTEPTPCAKWAVRDLLNHFVGGGHLFGALFRGEADGFPEGEAPDLVGEDHVAAYRAAMDDFVAGLHSAGALERTLNLPFGPVPGDAVVQILTWDLSVHCWDLATATGQAYPLTDEQVATADAIARGFLAPELRDGDTFAAEVQVSADATPLERLVAFAGRQP